MDPLEAAAVVGQIDLTADWPEGLLANLTDEQRRESALRAHYDLVSALIDAERSGAYLTLLAGASEAEVEAIAKRADEDASPHGEAE